MLRGEGWEGRGLLESFIRTEPLLWTEDLVLVVILLPKFLILPNKGNWFRNLL